MTKQGLLHAALPFLRSADDDCVKLCVQLLGLLLYNPTSKTVSTFSMLFNKWLHYKVGTFIKL